MRIGLCVKSIDGEGGIQKNYKLWYEMFKNRGEEVYLFVLDNPKYENLDENIIVLKGRTNKEKGGNLKKHLDRLGKFDLFLLNAEYLKKYMDKQQYFITVHNTWEVKGNIFKKIKRYRKLKAKYYNENLIGISKSVLDNITENLNIKVKSKHVVYAPHNFEKVRKLSEEIEINDKYIVAVGGLSKRKNYPLLIKAFNKIKNQTDLNLYIIGNGPEKNNLIKLIQLYSLQNRVKLLGFKQNPYPYIKNAKLLVSASNSEGLPRTIVEAFILNTPVVTAFSSDGIYEVMTDALKEYIVPKNNIEALSGIIIKALKRYPEIEKKYYEKFSEEESFRRLISLSSGYETSNTERDSF